MDSESPRSLRAVTGDPAPAPCACVPTRRAYAHTWRTCAVSVRTLGRPPGFDFMSALHAPRPESCHLEARVSRPPDSW